MEEVIKSEYMLWVVMFMMLAPGIYGAFLAWQDQREEKRYKKKKKLAKLAKSK